MLTRKLMKGGNAESRGWKALLNTAELCPTPVFSASEESGRCWESSAEAQPVLGGHSGEQRGLDCGRNQGSEQDLTLPWDVRRPWPTPGGS